jgi:hypothetical protein
MKDTQSTQGLETHISMHWTGKRTVEAGLETAWFSAINAFNADEKGKRKLC